VGFLTNLLLDNGQDSEYITNDIRPREAAVAVWKRKCGGALILIHDFDHLPPHCHVFEGGRHLKVELWSLEVVKPVGATPSPAVRKCLKQYQVEMLEAWERVRILPVDGP